MIKKSLIFTVFLLLIWTIIVNILPFSVSQHQWQGNIISAEKYLFDIVKDDNVIVGSSLSKRLSMENLTGFYNLSLNGQSIYEGLNVVRSKEKLPKNLFIEINVINRTENETFEGIISSPILNSLKSNFSIFRTDKQPFGLISIVIKDIFTGSKQQNNSHQSTSDNGSSKSEYQNPLFDEILDLRKELYSQKLDSLKINEQFQILKDHVNYFSSNGVNIIFFEMPVHPEIINLYKPVYLRNRVMTEFSEFPFIPVPDSINKYKTTDGLHLTPNSADKYSSYLMNKANDVIK